MRFFVPVMMLVILGWACEPGSSNTSTTSSNNVVTDVAPATDAGPPSKDSGSPPATTDAFGGGALCPPEGPYSPEPCNVAPDITLYDCDGNPVRLHSLCGRGTSFVYTWTGWCQNCVKFASGGEANRVYNQYRADMDFEMWFVITERNNGDVADNAYCQEVRDGYGLEMPVLYDRDRVTKTVMGMRENTADLVMTEGNYIVVNGPWALFTTEDAINGRLGECFDPN